MAKAPAAPQADTTVPPTARSKKLLVIVLVAVVVVLLAVAAVAALMLTKKGGGETSSYDQGRPAVDLARPPTFLSLDPFVVNLAPDEGERYLQVVIALRVPDNKTGETLKGFTPTIRHSINLILSSKLPSDLSTLQGREDLAEEITEELNTALGFPPGPRAAKGPIDAVLFNSFIIQ